MSGQQADLLSGQRAIVTGANSGIGEAVAKGLAGAGAKVAVNYVVNEPEAQRVVEEIEQNGGEAMAVYADVSNEADVERMFEQVIEAWQSVDILVNNAGIQRDAAFVDMSLDQWNKVMDVNLTGQFLCTRAAAREFLRRGVDQSLSCAAGKVICMSSVHEVIPWAGHVNYAASKGGVMMFMQSVAQELAHQKIRVNGIAPGAIKTPINRSAWETAEAAASLLELIPYERIGDPDDIAKATVWLASDQSDYVTGTTLFVDGGMTLYPGFREGG
ncbi:MAG: SDR family oxidoreductase [Candidatus Thiodiazotropha taylori]|nr:SDR family oxidoreductase [Candidatus Thiodiazotropha taylori]MCG7925854.1 SDR family oxidoreductase [Candidatus Thiodiazotropha taylori]MCG7944246.1 SDR family oxidoreductase [Candidatus Thiodiazotropha taylori]MCG7973898.1 SDR family oxidoreductase [Candidatus Thiodiazotropha taylori]MCG8038943.1 SDR family oxidoreductase [Candidatus Thiodiazotropha taylori]